MKLEGQRSFTKSRAELWTALRDPSALAATLPGVERLEVAGPDRYALAATVGLGSVTGLLEGTFSVDDVRAPESFVWRGSARGAPGSVELEARLRLSDADDGSALEYHLDATVAGPIADVGRRLLEAAAKRVVSQLFDAVEVPDRDALQRPPPDPSRLTRTVSDDPFGGGARVFAAGVAAGLALALAAAAVGRWSARGRR